jgi:hypothetical protein
MTVREFDIKPAYTEWDKMRARPGVKMADGERCYQVEKSGGTSCPFDRFPCKVQLRK